MGFPSPARHRQRQTLFDRFGVSFALLTILAVAALLLVLASRRCHLTLAAAPLFAGFVINVGWWLLFSPGRPRYVLIGVLVALVLASLTLVGQPALPRRVLIVATLVVVVAPNWGRWAFPFSGVAAHGWFKPSRSTANALKAVSVLDGELGGRKLTGQWWATVVDLEYLSSAAGRFDRFDPSAPPRPGEERVIAVNTKFLDKGDAAFTGLLQSCGPPLLDATPYLVVRCPPEPTSPGHASR